MTSLNELFNGIRKQQAAMDASMGLSSLRSLTWALENNVPDYSGLKGIGAFNGLGGLSKIARTIERDMKPSLPDQLQQAMRSVMPTSALSSLTSSLNSIAQVNPSFADGLKDFGNSQLLLSRSLESITKRFQFKENGLSSLGSSLNRLSNHFVKEAYLQGRFEDIAVAQEANRAVVQATEDVLADRPELTIEDLHELYEKGKEILLQIWAKSHGGEIVKFILGFIGLWSFLMTLFPSLNPRPDTSTKDAINALKQTVDSLRTNLNEREGTLEYKPKYRIARTKVSLRVSPKKKSMQIGFVLPNEKVIVLGTHHKYISIVYIDDLTGQFKSGYVKKKYFDEMDWAINDD